MVGKEESHWPQSDLRTLHHLGSTTPCRWQSDLWWTSERCAEPKGHQFLINKTWINARTERKRKRKRRIRQRKNRRTNLLWSESRKCPCHKLPSNHCIQAKGEGCSRCNDRSSHISIWGSQSVNSWEATFKEGIDWAISKNKSLHFLVKLWDLPQLPFPPWCDRPPSLK